MSILASGRASAQTHTFDYVQNGKKAGTETFTRRADAVTGDFVFDSTRTRVHYEGQLARDGSMPRLDIRVTEPGAGAKGERTISVLVGRDTTRLIERRGGKTDTLKAATQPGTLPFLNFSTGLTEVLIARARAMKAGSSAVAVPIVLALDFDTPSSAPAPSKIEIAPLEVTFVAADTVRLGTPREPDRLRVTMGADGRARAVMSGSNSKEHFSGRLK